MQGYITSTVQLEQASTVHTTHLVSQHGIPHEVVGVSAVSIVVNYESNSAH
jgi:hypothetical protein